MVTTAPPEAAVNGDPVDRGAPDSLAKTAMHSLRTAAAQPLDEGVLVIEERSVWQPDSWLIQRCWQTLAAAGEGQAALAVARLSSSRNPLASIQALHQVAKLAGNDSEAARLVGEELVRLRSRLFGATPGTTEGTTGGVSHEAVERLLLAAACAAHIDAASLAFACLERLDQIPHAWDRVYIQPDLRPVLADTIVQLGLHPLTSYLVRTSIRRFDDAGAQMLNQITHALATQSKETDLPGPAARLMGRCIDAFRNATLATLLSRRAAAAALGQAGRVDELLEQITTIANVQDARRESGLPLRNTAVEYLREVKRPNASADVDFQAYTLREAINEMPVRRIPRDQRVALADRLAMLAIRSDGWTAAAATDPLIELGALKYAVDVVERISEQDPTRSEGIISLVRGLLNAGDSVGAAEQTQLALAWAKSFDGRNPERATVWGLAEVYLEHGRPEEALNLLATRREPAGFWTRTSQMFREQVTDDQLHDDRLRLQALARMGWEHDAEIGRLVKRLRTWAPRLLEGDALIWFYVDGLLRPLLAADRVAQAWELLPEVLQALKSSSGDKHATRVTQIAQLLAAQAPSPNSIPPEADSDADSGEPTEEADEEKLAHVRSLLRDFLEQLWQMDAAKGIWQTVHSIEGSLPLLLALEGPDALVEIARTVDAEGGAWLE